MSTKTTFKRIALVTVATLGLGVLAAAPSQAVVQANSLTLSSATSTQLTYETSTASAAVATLSFLNTSPGDTVSVTAYLMSAPAGNTVTPILQVAETTSATVDTTALLSGELPVGEAITGQVAYVAGTAANAAVTAKFKVYMNEATKVGTYVVKLVPAVVSPSTGTINTDGVTLTITVSTNPAKDTVATSATSILTNWTDSQSATDVAVTGSKTVLSAGNKPAALIKVALKNAAGSAVTAESVTAVVLSGPGLLGQGAATDAVATFEGYRPTGRAISVLNGNWITVHPDGSSGVSTIQLQSAAGAVLATETVTFYGDATTISAVTKKAVIGTASGAGDNAILVTLKDAAGTNISTSTVDFYVSSSDATKISGAYTLQNVTYSATNVVGTSTYGPGYLIDLTGVAAGTASITVGTKSSATATTGINATAVSVRVGSVTPASVEVTLDKTAYVPGEKATIKVVLKDATGLVLADKDAYDNIFATGGIVASYALGAGSDTTSATSVLDFADGSREYTVYMPVTDKEVKFSWKTGTGLATVANQGVAGSVTVSLTSSAIEAANAATTAALAANDAVDALAATVAKLVANLKAQITALTKLIVKIQKKVGA